MDHGHGSQRSNIARPLSRLPLAGASTIPTAIHQDDPVKQSQLPRVTTSTARRVGTRPFGESNNATVKPSFGWLGRPDNGSTTPTDAASGKDSNILDTTPPNARTNTALVDDGDENANAAHKIAAAVKQEKRKPRLSLSERTIETLSHIPPTPSPTRRRSSTSKSGGSMGPPVRPASAMRTSRPTTPSTPSSRRPTSPVKRAFKPPGKIAVPPEKEKPVNALNTIYTPPRAFMRDHASKIGRPARDNRRSISTNVTVMTDDKSTLKPLSQPVKVKSLYDLRGAAAATKHTRTLSSKPSLPALSMDAATPKGLVRKPSFHQKSPQTGLLKARGPGENVIAPTAKQAQGNAQPKASAPHTKLAKRMPTSNESQKRESTGAEAAKSSAALRESIAKAKAARREELRKSGTGIDTSQDQWPVHDVPSVEPILSINSQSLKKKIQSAVTSGVLNLSTLSLKDLPDEVLTMYDYREDSGIAWAETVDLTKFLIADNEFTSLPEAAFPDWSEEQLLADPEKSIQFGGLGILNCHGNNISTLPLGIRRLQRLKVLNLSSNRLKSAAFEVIAQISSLRELRVAKNGLSGKLPPVISGMQNLQVLDLSDNQLDELPTCLADLQTLQQLLLRGNRLASLPISSLPKASLKDLDLSGNLLTGTLATDTLNDLQKLQMLDVSGNSLEYLCSEALGLPVLQSLAVHSNRLKRLPDLSNCAQLTMLTASANSLSTIPEGFYSLTKLRNVDFSGNNIKIVDSSLATMESLTAFNIAGNPLRDKRYLTMQVDDMKADLAKKAGPAASEDQQVNALARQQEINLDQVLEARVFTPKAGILDVSSQGLSSLDPSQVDLNGPVHTIRLADNNLMVFPVELLMHPSIRWNLRSLDLSHNPNLHPTDYFTSEVRLPLLQSLYIVSTGLTTLDTLTTYLNAPELKELNISCHRLTGHVPWVRSWYPSMTTLLASDNWFESIDVEAVLGLEVLDISNNEVGHLPPKIGLLGNHKNKSEPGKLRSFQCSGNRFRVPRLMIIEKGTEAILRDLRRMVPVGDVPDEWMREV